MTFDDAMAEDFARPRAAAVHFSFWTCEGYLVNRMAPHNFSEETVLRLAVDADFDGVFEIYMDPSVNPFMSWEVMSRHEFKPIFDGILAGGNLYVCELESVVAAVIRLDRGAHRRSHVAYVGGFGVLSGFQNKGLGKRIMQVAIEKLAVEGFKRIELIVEGDNPRAIKLYEELGFQREGKLRQFFKRASETSYVDDVYMARLLD